MERTQLYLHKWLYDEIYRIAKLQKISMAELIRADVCLVKIEVCKAVYKDYKPRIDMKTLLEFLSVDLKKQKQDTDRLSDILLQVIGEASYAIEFMERKRKAKNAP